MRSEILSISRERDSSKATTEKLKTDLQVLKQKVKLLVSKQQSRDLVKRLLLLRKALEANRQVNLSTSTGTLCSDVEAFTCQDPRDVRLRITRLRQKARGQRDQIYRLQVQNDRLQDRHEEHGQAIRSILELRHTWYNQIVFIDLFAFFNLVASGLLGQS